MLCPGRQNRESLRLAIACAAVAALMLGGLAAPASGAPQYTFKLLHAFCKLQNCKDGNLPSGGLLLDQEGDVFGATLRGGKYHNGVVFKLAPNGARYTEYLLHNFCHDACNEGSEPKGDLIADNDGILYGAAGFCSGSTRGGTIFSLTHGAKGFRARGTERGSS